MTGLMTPKNFRRGFGATLVAATLFALPNAAFANENLNLHIDPGFGLPTSGNLAPPSKYDNLAHVGPKLWLAVDYEVLDFLAIEAIGGVGTWFELDADEPNLDDKLTYTAGLGLRFRVFTGADPGKFASNFWLSAHAGLIGLAGPHFGLDAAVGYEIPVSESLALGPFVRGELVLGDVEGDNAVSTVFAGLSFAIGKNERGATLDSDGDGLSDDDERDKYSTDPNNPDTDSDGLNDGLEVETGTDPLDPDTDKGGIRDGVEDANLNGQVDDGETDPRVKDGDEIPKPEPAPEPEPEPEPDPDEDHDGVENPDDACPGTPEGSKVDERGCVEFVGKTFTLEGIQFDTASADILPASELVLRRAVAVLQDNPEARVEIGGHTDSRGKASMNRELSLNRAKAVYEYLVKAGIDPSRLTTKGYGPSQPIADNATEAGRAKNRRIEFKKLD